MCVCVCVCVVCPNTEQTYGQSRGGAMRGTILVIDTAGWCNTKDCWQVGSHPCVFGFAVSVCECHMPEFVLMRGI